MITKQCCGPSWGVFVDGKCATCGAEEQSSAIATESITWIPVTRELPDDEATVLVYAPHEDESVTLGYLDGGYWRAVDVSGDEPCLYRSTVTHWATLPKGPQ